MWEFYILMTVFFTFLFYNLLGFINDFFKFKTAKTKGPGTLPLTFIAYLFTMFSEADRFKILQKLSQRYPDYYGAWFGTKYLFITDEPTIAQKLLNYPECLEKNFFMELFGFSNGLISLKSDRWKPERKLLNHTFNIPAMQSFVPVFNRCIADSVERISLEVGRAEFNVQKYVSDAMMDAVLRTTFGYDVGFRNVEKFVTTAERLLDIIWKRSMNPLLYIDYIYSYTRMKKEEDELRNFLFDFTANVTREKRSEIENGIGSSDSINSFVYQLLKVSDSGRNYTQEEINDHIGTLIVAAGDTTACALGFVFLMIAMHQDVQEKIFQETIGIFGESENLFINYEDLSLLKYTEMVIKESMRLFSPAFGIFREVKQDVDLGFDNVKLPKGTNLIINLYCLHRKEAIWGQNANNFNPDNFLPENIEKRSSYSFIPFASGTRMCIGNKYSMNFMKMIVAQYIRKFKFTTKLKYEDVKIRAGVTIKLLGKHLVSIEDRK